MFLKNKFNDNFSFVFNLRKNIIKNVFFTVASMDYLTFYSNYVCFDRDTFCWHIGFNFLSLNFFVIFVKNINSNKKCVNISFSSVQISSVMTFQIKKYILKDDCKILPI